MTRILMMSLLTMLVVAMTACSGGAVTSSSKGEVTKGKVVFLNTCSACHGANAKGMPGLGKDLTASQFIKGLNDDQLLEFVKKGRPASDPANTTHVDMPPKGGNASLTDQSLFDVVAYIKSLNQ